MIGLCTDSSSQLPESLSQRFGVEIVPVTVTVDERDHLEGVDLDADEFYGQFAGGRRPSVSTSQPSPGQFALAYDELAARGCTEILSIHACSSISSTINSARLAVHCAPVPVRLVDSGTASFGVGCSVWAVGEALAAGATLDEAVARAESLAPAIANVFATGLDGSGIQVSSLCHTELKPLAGAARSAEAVAIMAERLAAHRQPLRVGIGIADIATRPFAAALEDAICATADVVEVVRYRIGPSVGAYTGPGTVGCFTFPAS